MSTFKFYRTTSSLENLMISAPLLIFTSQVNTGPRRHLDESLLELKQTLHEVQ